MGIESSRRNIINHDFVQGQGNSPSWKPASLVVNCKSLTRGWISLSLYKVVGDSDVCLSDHRLFVSLFCSHT